MEKILTPALLLDRNIAVANAERMLARAEKLGCTLRPHMKTHKTLEGGVIATGGSKRCITVSTLSEAAFFANGGFDDILYAVPIIPHKLERAREISNSIKCFHILVDSAVSLNYVMEADPPANGKWNIMIMVDCGYGRDGINWKADAAIELARAIETSSVATLTGIYTHGGHSYDCTTPEQVQAIAVEERDAVVGYHQKLLQAGLSCSGVLIGVGSTPTCSVDPSVPLEGVTEMHPGNYIYYDVMQREISSCATEDIALRVITRVIGHYQERNIILVDMGWTAVSAQGKENGYGEFLENSNLDLIVMKQEAGEVTTKDGSAFPFDKYPIGSLLHFLPWHACAATHQHSVLNVWDSNTKSLEKWKICKGWE
eukprot:m.148827 g.148827  ORF g.148827 m.148827 type:complete len:370 (+) comp15006_c0_seq3:176-1285(+)